MIGPLPSSLQVVGPARCNRTTLSSSACPSLHWESVGGSSGSHELRHAYAQQQQRLGALGLNFYWQRHGVDRLPFPSAVILILQLELVNAGTGKWKYINLERATGTKMVR